MAFDLRIFDDKGLEEEFVRWLVEEKACEIRQHFGRLWDYYANEVKELREPATRGRRYVLAQERGLPSRITGLAAGDTERKEIVIENDIAWRIGAMVDFLFGKPVSIVSKASDSRTRNQIETILSRLFEANGGAVFFQDMAVLGSVYGFVDCMVRPSRQLYERAFSRRTDNLAFAEAVSLAEGTGLELVEATRALPILDEHDYRAVRYYVQHFVQAKNSVGVNAPLLSRLLSIAGKSHERRHAEATEIIGPHAWQRYEDDELVAEGESPWGFVPVVHIQNTAQPFYYEGHSDVEPLIPLQDELNTRLSDRANRITMQAFRMYLAKCIEGANEKVVSPGRIWSTFNPDAAIEEFGGDSGSASEDVHITEIREAMDKTSGVSPIVAGLLKSKLGNLTSAVALRMTLIGTLSRTERKKFTYGRGISRIGRMMLTILDRSGVYPTSSRDRDIEVVFPSPLPEDPMEKLKEAKLKLELGVSHDQVLRELGYEMNDDGTTAARIEV